MINPDAPLPDAIRAHRVVVAHSALEHIHMGILNLTKILRGLDLPERVPCPNEADPKTPWPGVTVTARPISLGQVVHDAMARSDARLRDGSAADDWAVEHPAGRAVTVSARGEREAITGWLELDLLVRVLREDGTVVAENDDDGSRVRSRVTYTPERAGRYVVRVTTHGPWMRVGGYTLVLR